jgi:hypothetical protein
LELNKVHFVFEPAPELKQSVCANFVQIKTQDQSRRLKKIKEKLKFFAAQGFDDRFKSVES